MNRRFFVQSVMGLSTMTTLQSLKSLADDLTEQDLTMPLLFVGHGSPMNAIEDNEFSQRWYKMGQEIPQPRAVLCVSAHWLTRGTYVTAMEKPRTIHDFGGFPQALFDAQYPAPGSPAVAQETKTLIKRTEVGLAHDWGLDHGCWSVVKQMYPQANVPVLQLSIDYYQPPQHHYELAKELAALRRKGVLIIGSGNMVHNLGMIGFPKGAAPSKQGFNVPYGYDWAIEMNEAFKKHIADGNHQALIDYQKMGKSALLAIPTPDHYYPLLYVLGLQQANEKPVFFNDKVIAGSLTMTSVRFG
jgi:4,5-DOPA dioxygenase extradiol